MSLVLRPWAPQHYLPWEVGRLVQAQGLGVPMHHAPRAMQGEARSLTVVWKAPGPRGRCVPLLAQGPCSGLSCTVQGRPASLSTGPSGRPRGAHGWKG